MRTLVAALAIGTAAVLAAPTAAHSEVPTINWAHSDYEHDYGTLLVSATASSGITAVTAHIVTYETRQQVATTSSFALRDGTATDGVWASEPILLDDLGYYLVDVEVTTADGQHVRQDAVGDLYYAIASFFDGVSLNRTVTTYEERTVTLSGTLKGRQPGSGDIMPIGGETVVVQAQFNYHEVTTNPDGTFAGTVEIGTVDVGSLEEPIQAYFNPSSGFLVSSVSDVYTVVIDPRPVQVTAKIDKTRIDRGESVTVTGRVSWLVGGDWVPLAGVDVFVSTCANTDQGSCNYIATVVTDADGRYAHTTTPLGSARLGATYVRYAENGGVDLYTQVGFGQTEFFSVRQPSEFTSFYGGRNHEGLIFVSGQFAFTGGFSPAHFEVKLQYSTNGRHWRTYATFVDQYSIDVAGVDMSRATYWRAVYAGDRQFQPATSEVIFIPAV